MSSTSIKKTVTLSSVALLSSLIMSDGWAGMGTGGGCVSSNISMTPIVTPLNFASFSACAATAGAVEVPPNKLTVATSGCIGGTQGNIQYARVRIKPNQAANADKVKVMAPVGAVNIASGGNSMSVTSFDWAKKGSGPTYTINGQGTYTLDLGAITNVAGGQAGGTYTGTATISATCL